MPSNAERQFVRLISDVSNKYASWDPEIPIDVGDFGRITNGRTGLFFWRRRGTFLKEGNIYANGQVEKFGITLPQEYGAQAEEGGVAWVASENATKIDFDASIASYVSLPHLCFLPFLAPSRNSRQYLQPTLQHDSISSQMWSQSRLSFQLLSRCHPRHAELDNLDD